MTQDPNETDADTNGRRHATNRNRLPGIIARNRRSLIMAVAAVAAVAAAGTAWLGTRLDDQWLALTGIGIFLAMAVLWSALALVASFKLLKTARWRTAQPASASATSNEDNTVDHNGQSESSCTGR